MQLQGLMMMLFFTIVIPLIIISTNHNIFFILMALVLFVASLKDIQNSFSYFKGSRHKPTAFENDDASDEKEVIEELEGLTNVNIKKFSKGIGFVKNLIIILFFLYSSIYLDGLVYKSIISVIILYRIFLAKSIIATKDGKIEFGTSIIPNCARIICTFLSIFIIISSAYTIFSTMT